MKSIFSLLTLPALTLLSLVATSTASADIIVDFTTAGNVGNVITGQGFVFDVLGTGEDSDVTFTVTASAVIPAGGGANNGNISRLRGGLGSTVENSGTFINTNAGVSEVLRFTVSDVVGLAEGESLAVINLLSQEGNGNYGGAFGNDSNDAVTLTSDDTTTAAIFATVDGASAGVDTEAILLNTDNGNADNTSNTFAYSAGQLIFTNSFDIALTDLTRNDAITAQGFEFAVVPASVPEPSSIALLSIASIGLLVRRRK